MAYDEDGYTEQKLFGWRRVDAEWVSTKRELGPWVMESVAFARALSPKQT